MISRHGAAERRRNRYWQCQAYLLLDDVDGLAREAHYCTLAGPHFGKHLCWCGWAFEEARTDVHQRKLPFS